MLKDLSDEELSERVKKLDFSSLNAKKEITKTVEKKIEKLEAKKLPPSQFETNLQRFHFICKDLPSPNLFIDFDFYFMISACLARKVWIGQADMYRLYPNLYMIFVSDPGIGKSLPAESVNKILSSLVETKLVSGKLEELKLLNLGPDAITYEKLVLRAADATDVVKFKDGKAYHHASTTFCLTEELGMLFSDNTKKVVAFLMQCFNCGHFEGDTIKHGKKHIRNICINFLGCTTPELMRDLLKTKVLDSGFLGRTIFIFGDRKRPHPPLIKATEQTIVEAEYIKRHLRKLCKLQPLELKLTPEANDWITHWHYNKQDIHKNEHPRLKEYYARRKIHLLKLATAHAMMDDIKEYIEVEDLIEAESLLSRAEPNMHKALSTSGENPLAALADKILEYIHHNGATTKRKLMLTFFSEGDELQLARVFQYLVETDQCHQVEIKGKDGLKAK